MVTLTVNLLTFSFVLGLIWEVLLKLENLNVEGKVGLEVSIWELSGFFLALPYVLSVIHSTTGAKIQLCNITFFL